MDIMNNNGIYSTPRASSVSIRVQRGCPSLPGHTPGLPACRGSFGCCHPALVADEPSRARSRSDSSIWSGQPE